MQTCETSKSPFWLTSAETAAKLGMNVQTLTNWRSTQRPNQPKFYKTGAKSVRYKASDVDAWIEKNSFEY